MNPDDKQLLEALIRTEWPKLERFFRSKAPEVEIHDLAQNTLMAFVRSSRATHVDNPKAFLWTIARRQLIDFYRRTRAGGETFDSTQHSMLDAGPTLSSAVNRRSRLMRELQTLPADQQMALELKYGEGLTDAENAAALEVSVATVKRYVSAGLQVLRERYGVVREQDVGAAYREE